MKRSEQLKRLAAEEEFDLIVIGGGATGLGVTADAATRGLKVALVEQNDLCEGTSSRSTKLVHGGVRYLEKAVMKLDREQWDLVKEGLHERGLFLKNAPHLAHKIVFLTPLFNWFMTLKVFFGLILYDILSGKERLGATRLVFPKASKEKFAHLKTNGLTACVEYYDGQFNDTRMAVALAKTAEEAGAVIANHTEVVELVKEEGVVRGVKIHDRFSGKETVLRAKGVINAAGPFTDAVRQMEDESVKEIVKPSSGVHILLDKKFAPPKNGIMIPETEDGRVLFMLPWEGHALIGTTDDPTKLTQAPTVSKEEVEYILRQVKNYVDVELSLDDVKAAWSGLRPLVLDPNKPNTQELARTHVIVEGEGKLLTITGGKWTSYRRMAEDTVDRAVEMFSLKKARPCVTERLKLVGSQAYTPDLAARLQKEHGLDEDVAQHLSAAYGDRSTEVLELAKDGLEARLHEDAPVLQAEVVYAVEAELAERAADVLVRRLVVGLTDTKIAQESLPKVVELMASRLDWDAAKKEEEVAFAKERLEPRAAWVG